MKQGPTKQLSVIFIFSDNLAETLSILKPNLNFLVESGYRHLLYAESSLQIAKTFYNKLHISDISIDNVKKSKNTDYSSRAILYRKKIEEFSTKYKGGIICCLSKKYLDIVDSNMITGKTPSEDKAVYFLAKAGGYEFHYPLMFDLFYRWHLADYFFLFNPKSKKFKKDGFLPHSIYNFDCEKIAATKVINQGKYAVTKKGVNRTQQKFAIRRAEKGDQNIEVLKKVNLFKSILYKKDKEYILMEYAPGNDLDQLVSRLNYIQKLIICLLISDALNEIHKLNIIHRDLKANNVRVKISKDNIYDISVKIIDFNISVFLFKEKMTPTSLDASNSAHTSPEFRQKKHYDFRTDIYSLGYLFEKLEAQEMLRKCMLDVDPFKRPSLDRIIYMISILLENQAGLNLNTQTIIKNALAVKELQDNMAKLTLKENNRPVLHNYNSIKKTPLIQNVKLADNHVDKAMDEPKRCCSCNVF